MRSTHGNALYAHSALYTRLVCGVAVSVISFMAVQDARALPTGGTVAVGSAQISNPSATAAFISQTTPKAVINWQSFDTGALETTTFSQPSQNAITLNRVVGGSANPTQINGTLSAAGNVWIVNPKGVLFGNSANVTVGGLLATTANITDQNFANGVYKFDTPGNADASVINRGNITATTNGLVALVAPGVENSGTITGWYGNVILGSARTSTIDLYGDGLVNFALGQQTNAKASNQAGGTLAAAVVNSGAITNRGGNITLTADAAKTVVDQAINISGSLNATALDNHTGNVVINGKDGNVNIFQGTVIYADRGGNATNKVPSVNISGEYVNFKPTFIAESQAHGGEIVGDTSLNNTTATGTINIQATKDVTLNATGITAGSSDVFITAGGEIAISPYTTVNSSPLTKYSQISTTTGDITLKAGTNVKLESAALSTKSGDISITAGDKVTLTARNGFDSYGPPVRPTAISSTTGNITIDAVALERLEKRVNQPTPVPDTAGYNTITTGGQITYLLGARTLPQGGTVAAGAATVSQAGHTLNVNQTSDKAVINWSNFDIGAAETANFYQPNSSSITLNRITGTAATQISGALNANGKLWIVNPYGVVFNQGSQVNVGSLVASAAGITDSDFMSGTSSYRFGTAANSNATIINNGTITVDRTENGLAAFIAPGVQNNGTINAQRGSVQLGSSKTYSLSMVNDGTVTFANDGANPDQKTDTAVFGAGNELVGNTGAINATGGNVALLANVSSNLGGEVINASGYIGADTWLTERGSILIDAGKPGVSGINAAGVGIRGTLSAKDVFGTHKGGTVTVLGSNIKLYSPSKVDVRGNNGGGDVTIGGYLDTAASGFAPFGLKITSSAYTATNVTTEAGSSIDASALNNGNGGRVALQGTRADLLGTIASRGAGAGNGGNTIVSTNKFGYSGSTDLSSTGTGQAGTFAAILSGGAGIAFYDSGTAGIAAGKLAADLDKGTNVQITATGISAYYIPMEWSGNGSLFLQATTGDVSQYPKAPYAWTISHGNGSLWVDAAQNVLPNYFYTNTGDITIRAGNIVSPGFGAIQSESGNITIEGNSVTSLNNPNSIGTNSGLVKVTLGSVGADVPNNSDRGRINSLVSALAQPSAKGAEIYLRGGVYEGYVNLDKDRISISSLNGPDSTILNGGVIVTGDNSKLSGLTLKSTGGVSLAYIDTLGGTVDNVTITGANAGLLLRNADDFSITNSRFLAINGTAIGATNSDRLNIANNSVFGAMTGLDVISANGATVQDNTVDTVSGIAVAVRNGTTGTSVNRNTIKNAGSGIIFNQAGGNTVSNNTVSNIGVDGIAAFSTGAAGVTVTGNTVSNVQRGTGIALNTASGSVVSGNTVTDTHGTVGVDGAGISIANSAGTTLSGNQLARISGNGIEVISSNQSKVLNNTLAQIGQTPIVVVNSNDVEQSGNTF